MYKTDLGEDLSKLLPALIDAGASGIAEMLPQLLADCDGQEYGYSNNITAAVFSVANAINRLAAAVEKR